MNIGVKYISVNDCLMFLFESALHCCFILMIHLFVVVSSVDLSLPHPSGLDLVWLSFLLYSCLRLFKVLLNR